MSLEIKLGMLSRYVKQKGIRLAALVNYAETEHHGLQVAPLNVANELMGGQVGWTNAVGEGYGFQTGAYNFGEVVVGGQIGPGNGAFYVLGAQVGALNDADSADGIQAGLVNWVKDELLGFQIGLVCTASNGKYLQLGLLTIRNKGPWYTRVSPGIGWSNDPILED